MGQIRALFDNCLKLASENKITAKNTWDLPLIDHLSDLVQVCQHCSLLSAIQTFTGQPSGRVLFPSMLVALILFGILWGCTLPLSLASSLFCLLKPAACNARQTQKDAKQSFCST